MCRIEAGGQRRGIVGHNQITRAHEARQIGPRMVRNASVGVDDQQSRPPRTVTRQNGGFH
jgi:hypothetical protein